jgi:hypothetical protein
MIEGWINEYFIGLGEGLLEGVWKWLGEFALSPTELTKNGYIGDIFTVVLTLSIALSVLLLVYNLAKKQVQDIGGFSNRSTGEILIKSILGVIFAYCTPYILFKVFLTIANSLNKIIFAKGINLDSVKKAFTMGDIVDKAQSSSAMALTFTILIIMVVVFAFQYIKREGELIVLYILAPFAATTMVNEEMNIFSVWVREVIAVVFMQPLQIMVLYLVINLISGAKGMEDLYFAVGLMFVLILAPSWLRKFLYSTGTGKSMINAAGGAGKFAMYRFMYSR